MFHKDNYENKYLKYKNKYLKLKYLIDQKGGEHHHDLAKRLAKGELLSEEEQITLITETRYVELKDKMINRTITNIEANEYLDIIQHRNSDGGGSVAPDSVPSYAGFMRTRASEHTNATPGGSAVPDSVPSYAGFMRTRASEHTNATPGGSAVSISAHIPTIPQVISAQIIEINSYGLPVIIILGANSKEDHIIDYMGKLDIKSTIICISLEAQQEKIEQTDTKGSIYHLNMDFNNVEHMRTLQELIVPLNKIIVEWSTYKFFSVEYNFVTGKIIQILFNLLRKGGEFYSGCCWEIATVRGSSPMKYIPYLVTYATQPSDEYLVNVLGDPDETSQERTERVYRDYIHYFIQNLINETKDHFHFEGLIKVESKETDTYPLINPKRIEFPYRYFKLIKK